jgi:Viral coat protein P2 N-terminal domain
MFYDRILKVENQGASKTALITLGLNATYDRIILLLSGGLTAAMLTAIRIKANDIEIFTDTGPQLNLRQAYANVSTAAGEVTIDFTEPNARGDAAQQYLASIPANLLKKLVIEVDLSAAFVGTLAAAAEFRGPTKNPFILKRRVFNYFAAGAADNDLFLPSGGNGGIIKRVWLHDGGIVSKAMLRVGGFIALNFVTIAELARIQTRNRLVPQANIDVLDFIADGNLQGALNTAAGQDVALRLTSTGAGAIQGYIDYIDPIGNLK